MTINEYFGDWAKAVDLNEVDRLMKKLISMKKDMHLTLCPLPKDTFKCFHLCPFNDLRVVILGYDPYPNLIDNKPVATGVAFANSSDTLEENYSPSLKVLGDSVIDFTKPHENINFDPSLEKWEEQGVLMLNSSLSCIAGKTGSHYLMWRPFIIHLLKQLSHLKTGIVYLLLGKVAQSYKEYIKDDFNYVLSYPHPSFYARKLMTMPHVFDKINNIFISQNGYGIKWYNY